MKQQTFAFGDFERYRKPTRKEKFLAEMDGVVPWKQLNEKSRKTGVRTQES